MRTTRVAIAFVAATLAAAIAAVATITLRDQPRAASPAISASPSAPSATQPRVLFAHYVVLDTVPGGGPVITDAYDSLEVLTPGGVRQSHAISGVAVGEPAFDGQGRVAYWRGTSIARPSGRVSGPYEAVVWDLSTGRERVLLTKSDEGPPGGLLWSTDGKSLVVVPAFATSNAGVANRLIAIDAASGTSRPLPTDLSPIFMDAQVIVGVTRSSYVVLDASSGAVRTQTPLRTPTTFLGESAHYASGPDGMVLELVHRFEQEAGPLRVWNVRDPATVVATVDERGISDPRFWPGRTEIVFTGRAGFAALDYGSGRTRPLTGPRAAIEAVESGGRFALVRSDVGLQIVERVGDELRTRIDLQPILEPTLNPLGIVFP